MFWSWVILNKKCIFFNHFLSISYFGASLFKNIYKDQPILLVSLVSIEQPLGLPALPNMFVINDLGIRTIKNPSSQLLTIL